MTLPRYAMNQSSFPENYERELVGPLFRPWAELTVDEVNPGPAERVLDVACGTGIVARVASERIGSGRGLVGVDISPGLLAVARAVAPDIDWREGYAGALPLADGEQFEVVLCQQGLQFFPDKPAAAAQMRRALAQDGRLAVSTWLADDEIPFFRDLRRVAEGHLGPIADQRFSFGDGLALESLLRGAGFDHVRSTHISRTIRFEDVTPFLQLNAMALVGMSAGGMALGDQERKNLTETIANESVAVAQTYGDGRGVAFEATTNLATARG